MIAVFSETLIQALYKGLLVCYNNREATDPDVDFLQKNSLDKLYRYDIADWLTIFKYRLHALQGSEYDWTRIGQSKRNWSNDSSHVNYHWFKLAKELGSFYKKRVTDIIFPDVEMYSKDIDFFQDKSESFGELFYDDDFKRLVCLKRILILAKRNNTSSFASYDSSGVKLAVSPHEMEQIYAKLRVHRKEGQQNNLQDFRQNFLATWGSEIATCETLRYKMADLNYPLFEIVLSYYSELEYPTKNGQTETLIKKFYKKDLSRLRVKEVNAFYGQCLDTDVLVQDPTYLGVVLLNILNAKGDLDSILPLMVKLAVWLTIQNPAKVIAHPSVDVMYQRMELGPYCNQKKLAEELWKLFDFKKEFEESDYNSLNDLYNGLSGGAMAENIWFPKIYNLFGSREVHNHQATFRDICKSGPMIGSFEYVYHHRTGANAVFIKIAQMLHGWGVSQRYGVEDWFQILMQELKSGVDAVTGCPLSSQPLSHYARPEHDRTYLASLENAEENYRLNNGYFYDVNNGKSVPFSLRTYKCITAYSSFKFREYPRMPRCTNYPLDDATLIALKDLINHSLHHEAAIYGDGYILKNGISEKLGEGVVEYEISQDQMSVKYQIKDAWQSGMIYMREISLRNIADRQNFLAGYDDQRLMFIIHKAIGSGHARSNLTLSKYFSAYAAYDRFREYTHLLKQNNPVVFENLMRSSMRFDNSVRNFGEIWANGFPDCMSIASQWFSTLFLDHVPNFKFCDPVEKEWVKDKGFCTREYLISARRDSQNIYENHHSPEETQQLEMKLKMNYLAPPTLTEEISDMLKITDNLRHISNCKRSIFFNSPSRWNNYSKVIEACTEQDLNDSHSSSGVTSSEGSLASSFGSHLCMVLVTEQNQNVNIPGSGDTSSRSSLVDGNGISDQCSSEEDIFQFSYR